MKTDLLLATTDTVPGREIVQTLGLVRGNTIRTRHLGVDIVSGLKALIGGEIKGFVKMLSDARDEATQRMIDEAHAMGADAIVCIRYTSADAMKGSAEILAYGTAVKLR